MRGFFTDEGALTRLICLKYPPSFTSKIPSIKCGTFTRCAGKKGRKKEGRKEGREGRKERNGGRPKGIA